MSDTDTDHEAEKPTEPKGDGVCPVCGVVGVLITLDDGSVYCQSHRGLTTVPAPVAPAPVVAPTPEPPEEVAAAPVEPPAIAEPEVDQEAPWPTLAPVKMVAGLIFDAALATFHEDGTFGDPPTGWAPPPADESPFMEAGAALAVAVLMEAAEIDRDVIQTLADTFCGRTPTSEGQEHD